ncbi:hypothetical protein DPMN_143691 [Dreissena polymorpha]|uniref:Uncharacterized protein n=1 Tax=Dreissena polymorpha TaxID=45954 RepID=A0A9D4GDI2_DREPO|nr:hypothetical protein DPMN_143691 [Dreissena polymorpha]
MVLRQVYTDPDIKDCAFHFNQALWRKCQEIGLRTAFEIGIECIRCYGSPSRSLFCHQPTSVPLYGRSVRTNNDLEGWHNRLNHRAKKGNLSFYLLITLLLYEAKEVPMQCKLIKENKLQRHQSRQTRATQGRLCKAWDLYGEKEISTSELLDEC